MESDPRKATLYRLSASPVWQDILAAYNLTQGFAFWLVLTPDSYITRQCEELFLQTLTKRGQAVKTYHADSAEALYNLSTWLLEPPTESALGAVWVSFTGDLPEDAVRDSVARVNEWRNHLAENYTCLVIFSSRLSFQELLRNTAPDLWSIRRHVFRIEPTASPEIRTAGTEHIALPVQERFGYTGDPELAIKEADTLQGRPGMELERARMLHRAGEAWMNRYDWEAAIGALYEALKLRQQNDASTWEIAKTAERYAQALYWGIRNDDAIPWFDFAAKQYDTAQDLQGEANCIKNLGDIAFRTGDNEEAVRRYNDALLRYQRIQSPLGEANCIRSLGDIAFHTGDNEEAVRRYNDALPRYQRAKSPLGEANCIKSLGDIAFHTGDNEEAVRRYNDALPRYQRAKSPQGEANCIKSLGDIAFRIGDNEEAVRQYNDALPRYQKAQDPLGEANCIQSLGDIAFHIEDNEEAVRRYNDALPRYQKAQSLLGEANCIQSLGDIAFRVGDNKEAARRYDDAILRYQKLQDLLGEANCIKSLGDIAFHTGNNEEAARRYNDAILRYQRTQEPLGEANCIRSLGQIDAVENRFIEGKIRILQALEIYKKIQHLYAQGIAWYTLIPLADNDAEREEYREAARQAWTESGATHLLHLLEK